MNLLPLLVRREPRAVRALLLVATLLLGSASIDRAIMINVWHHIEDPHCGDSSGAEHFCGACNNLHGGTLAAGEAPDAAPAISGWAGYSAPGRSEYAASLPTAGAPRAPPAA